MSRKRLTREVSRNQTTERLLDATQKLITGKGLCAASIADIAAEAGYTRGAFHSNFSSKEVYSSSCCSATIGRRTPSWSAVGSDALSLDHIQQRSRDLYGQIYRDNESFMTRTETPVPATVMATAMASAECGQDPS